jgi:molecular chaperone GrpE
VTDKKKKVEEKVTKEDTAIELETEEEQPVVTDEELAEQYLANWQRSQADFANFKKRSELEKAESIKYANAILMTSLLPVLDDMERALDNIDQNLVGLPWVDGIDLIYRKLLATVEGQGLTKIEAQGQDFDPNFHQAVLYEEGEEGKVIEELQKGYVIQDRLLRPTMVKVGKGKEESEPETVQKQ